MASEGYHEPLDALSEQTRNLHRGLISLIEELEAIDWYQQRLEACSDEALKAILLHNRNEEIEHATMTLEWIRRQDSHFDAQLRRYLFTAGSIVQEETGEGAEPAPSAGLGSTLGIGNLKAQRNGSSET